MQALRPRLFHKGLILLFVPLLFEVAVAASIIYLQHYYGEAVKAEALRKRLVFHINEFWYYQANSTTTNLGRAFIKDYVAEPRRFREAAEQYDILTKLLAENRQQLQRLAQVMNLHGQMRDLCGQLKPVLTDSSGRLAQILALKSNLQTLKEMMPLELAIGDFIRSFRQYELVESDKAAEKVRHIAWLIQVVLAVAIIGSIVIAYFLFRYFMRGIHRGVQALISNIKRFKAGEPLAPAIGGTDELAVLDARFHEMADEVAAAQRMKQAFIKTISRELRVPISATRDYVVQLSNGSDSDLSEFARARAQKVEKSLDRLLGLMNDLLVLEGTRVGPMEIAPRQCSLTEAIQSSIDAVAVFAEKSDIRLEGPTEQVFAYADPDRIVQVLVNLLSNAIKFSSPGSTVTIGAYPTDSQVEVRVKDTGRGIPSHLIDAVFEKFQQVDSTDATEKGGTGLGLPICKEIIELHGGKIGVESEEGRGSTFWFRLPALAPVEV